MAIESSAELLVLHAVRIMGMAEVGSVARRFTLDRATVEELLLDYEAHGWVQRVGFADVSGWALTSAGRDEGRRMLSLELAEAGVADTVATSHTAFVGLNAQFLQLITNWQIRPTRLDPMAINDHADWQWDEEILRGLAALSRSLRPVSDQLAQALSRFAGYSERFAAALRRVEGGERKWVDEPKIDSCHTVWFELHEDLLATLGLARGEGA